MIPSLLDFPDPILEKIISYVAYKDPSRPNGLPYNVLPIASTCKRLRNLSSTTLSDDSTWMNQIYPSVSGDEIMDAICGFRWEKSDIADSCNHLSNVIHQPSTQADPKRCRGRSCSIVHRKLAWYRLAAPCLRSLSVTGIAQNFSKREAFLLIDYFASVKAPVKYLDIEHKEITDSTQTRKYMEITRKLLTVVCSSIRTIHVNHFEDPELNRAICSQSFPHLKVFRIDSDMVSRKSESENSKSIQEMYLDMLKS